MIFFFFAEREFVQFLAQIFFCPGKIYVETVFDLNSKPQQDFYFSITDVQSSNTRDPNIEAMPDILVRIQKEEKTARD